MPLERLLWHERGRARAARSIFHLQLHGLKPLHRGIENRDRQTVTKMLKLCSFWSYS